MSKLTQCCGTLLALLMVALLTACGGGECISEQLYQDGIRYGYLTPRPPLADGERWTPPLLLRPAAANAASAPKLAVITTGDGRRWNAFGPYYVPGEAPPYVCR